MNAGDCTLIVFAKAPLAGYAKSRLVPALGSAGAAALAGRMLVEAVRQAVDSGIGAVELCCAPDVRHPAFTALARHAPIALTAQGDGDLGARMHRAFERTLQTHRHAVLVGTDAPGLDSAYLRGAALQLQTHDAVLGPAHDGGYTLIGLKRPAAVLFEGMVWSTPWVLEQTRDRLECARLSYALLQPLADIDEPGDLRHLPTAWRSALPLQE